MLLRVRVTLPDRPGALGQVARTLGVAGADIVQVVVLERLGGRAVDDFTVVWPGASRVERLLAGLAAIPGVQVDGVWKAIGAPVSGRPRLFGPPWGRPPRWSRPIGPPAPVVSRWSRTRAGAPRSR
jgi:hypothetical protein